MDTWSPRFLRGAAAGVVGLFAGSAIGIGLLFLVGPFTVYNEELQSPKLTAVWSDIEPLPLMMTSPLGFAAVLAVLGAAHGIAYAMVAGGLPGGTLRRGLLYGLVIWLLSMLFFELQAPFALLGEPLPLVGVELSTQLVGALLEGVVIAALYGAVPRVRPAPSPTASLPT